MTLVLGLTGSIGMGKSTTAALFREAGVPVHDADATVHALYAAGPAVALVEAVFPGTTGPGGVDRAALGARVVDDPVAMRRLEAIIHPLVRQAEDAFLAEARAAGHPIVVLDIPLLFETGAQSRCDAVLVVSAPSSVQKERVLARPGMTEERFAAILARQMPDSEKRARADVVIDTGSGLEAARRQVEAVLRSFAGRTAGDRENAGWAAAKSSSTPKPPA
jgi:dephospho-CoA kinase